LSRKAESEWEARLSIGNETKTITHKGPYVFEPSRQEIQEGIEVRAVGDDALFASAVVTGYTKAPPQKVASGMQIQRRLYNLEGQRLEKNAFHIGEMILVRLDVRAKEQVPDALVVDLIPAGMEIENLNLEHSINIQDISIDGNPIWRMMDQASLKHQEFRDDRYVCALTLHPDREYSLFYPLQVVSPGRFFVPPPMAESMYRPEIRAIGQTGEKIKVVNRPQ
ncbi:MAG: hypothetical protein KGY41_03365, partial [Desulfovermiculus sp.]|nr:hypothetical protein [Desulfovermiculus sp.]